jgi:hypothetical protein
MPLERLTALPSSMKVQDAVRTVGGFGCTQFGVTRQAALKSLFHNHTLTICDQIVAEVRATLVRKFSWKDEEVLAVSRSEPDERRSGGLRLRTLGSWFGLVADAHAELHLPRRVALTIDDAPARGVVERQGGVGEVQVVEDVGADEGQLDRDAIGHSHRLGEADIHVPVG